jgi:hypothetical protein
MLQGLVALINSTLGMLIIIVLAFSLMSRGKMDLAPIFAFLGRCLFGLLTAVFHLSAIPAEALAQAAPPAQRKLVRQLGQVLITALLICGTLIYCGGAFQPR